MADQLWFMTSLREEDCNMITCRCLIDYLLTSFVSIKLQKFQSTCLELSCGLQGASEKDIVHSGLAQTMEGIALVR